MLRALSVLPLIAALTVPTEASAAVASLVYEEPIPGIEPNPAYALTVRAGSGEANLLMVEHDGSAYTVRDGAGVLAAGPGCESLGPRAVRCAAMDPNASHSVFVNAGNGADYAGVGALPRNAAVELRGGRGTDYVVGGDGADLLVGGSGGDHMNGQSGDDTIGGGTGGDRIDGGLGRDRLSYEERRARVRVDLGAGGGGSRGERDRFIGVEDVVGGRARDVLAGDAGPNRLLGGPGGARDLLSGRQGADVLAGYGVSGGGGDDSIDARTASCGRGTDRLIRVAFKPLGPFPSGCEAIVAGTFLELAPDPVRLTRAVAVYRLRCVAAIGRCAGTLELRDADGLLGRAAFARPDDWAGAPARIKIPLSRPAAGGVGTVRLRAEPAYRRDRFRTRLRQAGRRRSR